MSSVLKVVRPFVLILGLPSGSAFAEVALAPNKPAPAVSTVEAARREIVEQVVVTGSLVPRDEILVTPEIEGYRVTEVLVEEGMRVERGQILARLSRDLIDQQIASAGRPGQQGVGHRAASTEQYRAGGSRRDGSAPCLRAS